MHQKIAGSKLHIVPGVGHLSALEKPEYVAELITEHLNATWEK